MAESGTSSAASSAAAVLRSASARVWHAGREPLRSASWRAIDRGTPDDTRTCFEIFETAVDDLGTADRRQRELDRRRSERRSTSAVPCSITWRRRATLWWIAEDEATGRAVGYARSIMRDGVRELTEFFVLPDAQSSGIGRGLLERAFPSDGARHRAIVATIDPRAIARYLRTGLDARLPMIGWEGTPRDEPLATDLERERDRRRPTRRSMSWRASTPRILDFRRDDDHRWLASSARAGCIAAMATPSGTAITRRDPAGVARTRRCRRPTCRCSLRTARRRLPAPATRS